MGYLKTFLVYLIVSVAFYFIVYSIYAFIAGGKKGVKAFWKNVIPATFTAIRNMFKCGLYTSEY